MSEWQTIEMAPKDGTRILIFSPGYAQGRGLVDLVGWRVPEPFGREPNWTTDSQGPGYSGTYDDTWAPTHWMPLPAPPLT